jgi:hypothetical protein
VRRSTAVAMESEGHFFLRGSSVWIKNKSIGKGDKRKVTGQDLEFPYVIINTPTGISVFYFVL